MDQQYWVGKKVQGWDFNVETLSGMKSHHQYKAYSRIQKSLPQDWKFLQCFTPHIGPIFAPVYKSMWENFLPALVFGSEK